MSRQKARKARFKLKDYNQTTEPVECVVLSPTAPVYTIGNWSPDAMTVPAPQPEANPVPWETPSLYSPRSPSAVYPVLPPPPYKKYRGSPPGGSSADYPLVRLRRWRRSPIPGLLGVFFVLVQLVLLARVGCLLFNVQSTAPWFTLLLAASNLFVSPMRWLVANINLRGSREHNCSSTWSFC